jgi:cytochrome oxidase Cu insertion factor (SCO1/SenC/PrrC family)
MNERGKIVLIYAAVAVLSVGIVGTAVFLRGRLPEPEIEQIVGAGRADPGAWFTIGRDLEATNQAGRRVRLSELRGKVWVVAEFFAVCPKCAVRNGSDLREIYDEFKDDPDFHVVCISVDPEQDTVDKLSDYAAALGADVSNWWFLTGEREELHAYLSGELKFLDIRERSDPEEIEQLGRYAHDLGLMVVDRSWQVIGKRDLAWAREEGGEGTYDEWKRDLKSLIGEALARPVAAEPVETAAAP